MAQHACSLMLSLCIVLGFCFTPEPAAAQDDGQRRRGYDNIATRQKETRVRLHSIEQVMLRTADGIEKEHPGNARRLREACSTLRGRGVAQEMEAVETAVRDGHLTEAYLKSGQVVRELLIVLNQLKGGPPAEKAELEELKALIEELRQLEDEQAAVRRETLHGERESLVPHQGDLEDRTAGLSARILAARFKSDRRTRAARLLAGAGRDMDRAKFALGQGQSSAADYQGLALRKLVSARKHLEARAERVKGLLWSSFSTKLTNNLARMLDAQLRINKKTAELDSRRDEDGTLARPHRMQLRRVAHEQSSLAAEAKKQKSTLEERKAFVYAGVLTGIAADMENVSLLLREQDTGAYTRSLQTEIVSQLEALLKILTSGGGKVWPEGSGTIAESGDPADTEEHNPQPGDGKQPLIALLLLRRLQREILQDTVDIHNAILESDESLTLVHRKTMARLAHREGALAEAVAAYLKAVGRATEQPRTAQPDLLQAVEELMTAVQRRLATLRPGPVTQEAMRQILYLLDRVIEVSTQAALVAVPHDSNESCEPEMKPGEDGRWGTLPIGEKDRKPETGRTEPFPDRYAALLKNYFRLISGE